MVKPFEWVGLATEIDISTHLTFDFIAGFDQLLHPPSGIASMRGLLFKRGQNPRCRYLITGDFGSWN